MSNIELDTTITIRLSSEMKQLLRVEAAHNGAQMSDFARELLMPQVELAHADRLRWDDRKRELAQWPEQELDERADYLLSKMDTERLSDDEKRELDYLTGLLNTITGVTERIAERAA